MSFTVIEISDNKLSVRSKKTSWIYYLKIHPRELLQRILLSFWPSLSAVNIFFDLVGPILAVIILCLILQYGHTKKVATVSITPRTAVVIYILLNSSISFLLHKIGGGILQFVEVFAFLSYGLYSQIVTLLIPFLFSQEDSNTIFFICFVIFGGLSAIRFVIVFVLATPKPVLRLLVCSFASILHLLFLIFIYFGYMHKNFVYGSGNKKT